MAAATSHRIESIDCRLPKPGPAFHGGRRPLNAMVNKTAAKAAVILTVATLGFVLAGAILRFVTRILTFAVLAALVIGLGYLTYRLVAGWTAADETDTIDEPAETKTSDSEAVDQLQREYTQDRLTDDEFERELEAVLESEEEEPVVEHRREADNP